MSIEEQVQSRRTFAIISHPDAGKTTITEKLLLLGGVVQSAGTVKGRKSDRHVVSDWMELEKQRGISVTTSVMQFPYHGAVVNLLDTPGHEDFSEDTYRTLTAVDSALMVIDGARGVEKRTIKLMEVCRLRDTPIMSFVNKLDREIRDPVELMDEIESVLGIECAPLVWPVGMGRSLRGIYHLYEDVIYLYSRGKGSIAERDDCISGLDSEAARTALGSDYASLVEEVELVRGASHQFDPAAYLRGRQTPVYFGSALGNFGVRQLLDGFVESAPPPLARSSSSRKVGAREAAFSGFVFKIQANMDPKHRDRVAFLRICSGRYQPGMKLLQVGTGKEVRVNDALTFFAGGRSATENACSGDILGLQNHGTIRIGDTFTQGEQLRFLGIPHFAPELFRRVRLRDPLKSKQLRTGLTQLSEEGTTQVFMPLTRNDLIVGAIGVLQFDVVAFRLRHEYKVDCTFESVAVQTARWVDADDSRQLTEFRNRNESNLALDASGHLTYLAPTRVNLTLAEERWPDIRFRATREIC